MNNIVLNLHIICTHPFGFLIKLGYTSGSNSNIAGLGLSYCRTSLAVLVLPSVQTSILKWPPLVLKEEKITAGCSSIERVVAAAASRLGGDENNCLAHDIAS